MDLFSFFLEVLGENAEVLCHLNQVFPNLNWLHQTPSISFWCFTECFQAHPDQFLIVER